MHFSPILTRPSAAYYERGEIMSAYIVEDSTINRIIAFLARKTEQKETWLTQPLLDLGYKLDTLLGCKRLGEELFTLNCDAIEQRYGEGEAQKMSNDEMYHFLRVSSSGNIQTLKAMRCWLYQCSEGDVGKNPLYQAIDQVSLKLAYEALTRTKEYEACSWG